MISLNKKLLINMVNAKFIIIYDYYPDKKKIIIRKVKVGA